jgi:STIP1 family protein 1
MARLRLQLWESVIADCEECLRLSSGNMKAHYYLSQALLAEHDYSSALEHALQAHELCVANQDKSLSVITTHVLRCKKERWEALEKTRQREEHILEAETLDLLGREKQKAMADTESDLDRAEIEKEWDANVERMQKVFNKARTGAEQGRVVPDWVIDDITFGILVDPVIVSGASQETAVEDYFDG